MTVSFGPRRSVFLHVTEESRSPLSTEELAAFELFDVVYRSLCAILFNYVPTSGHPGGSISSGRIVELVLFDAMEYDLSNPDRRDADMISYSAGHKALGLYAMWALRNEVARITAPELIPSDKRLQLRLEDLLGFRRNPTTATPLFREFGSKPLDGHPTPATPFLRLATGASGVGVASSLGLAFAAADVYGDSAPRLHIIEGEGGLTPGRVAEALAFAGTASLGNVVLHLDWNQASIDSDHVTREEGQIGEYVQWDPMELFYLHDWNVVHVPQGMDFQQIVKAQHRAMYLDNGQPTAIVYRTVKGWQYGIEGRASHGAGHKMCSAGFFDAIQPLLGRTDLKIPSCEPGASRCNGGKNATVVEACLWESLGILRKVLEENAKVIAPLGARLADSRKRLDKRARKPRPTAPDIRALFAEAERADVVPNDLQLDAGSQTTLRAQLGKVLNHYNKIGGGAVVIAAADLLGSTSIADAAKGFASGFYNRVQNPASRTLAVGGICEDAMSGILSGIASYGEHLGTGSSYGAFLAPLGHIAARLHAIGSQARQSVYGDPYRPFMLICAHAGLKTGEDGPTHADPQPLQLLQENFPRGTMITLTPWDPQEIFHLISAALAARPAVIAPFVTRPNERVLDRALLRIAPASDAKKGVYALRRAKGESDGTIVLQESGITYAFVETALPLLDRDGLNLDVYYVASAELFDRLTPRERVEIFPEAKALEAMGITGFTLATMYRWIRTDFGREHSLHPYMHGHYLGSGSGEVVIAEAGLDGESQYRAIVRYVEERRKRLRTGTVPAEAPETVGV
jgi:transketolase